MFYYLGIDVGKFSHSICLLTQEGQKSIFQIDNTKKGFEKLKEKLLKLNCEKNILIGMEATGHYFLNLYDWLLQCNFTLLNKATNEIGDSKLVTVSNLKPLTDGTYLTGFASEQIALLNPLQVKSFRNTNLRGAKSDNVDAERIAVLLRFGDFKRCNVPLDKLMNLRELTRLRSDLVANIGDLKRKIISVLDRIFPEFMIIFSNRFGKTTIDLISNYTPEELSDLSLEELNKVIKKLNGRGRGISKKKIQELHNASQNSIGISFGKEAFKISPC